MTKQERINEIMENITEEQNLGIIRNALENQKDDFFEELKSFDINWNEYHCYNVKAKNLLEAEDKFRTDQEEGCMGDTYHTSGDIQIEEVK